MGEDISFVFPSFKSIFKPIPNVFYWIIPDGGNRTLADYVAKSTVKSSVRNLTAPLESMTVFQNLITDIISNNPWGCVDYVSNGATIDGCLKGTERYSGKVVYKNALAKPVGQISVTAYTSTGFGTDIITILGTVALNTAMVGTSSPNSSEDGFSVQIKCNHPSGEKYTVTVKRDSITVSSYEADAIVTAIETWADA